jgi:ribosome-associated toxin RatA of RatAB toxin-antitoxin module
MPRIENEVTIAAPLARVYALARDAESFPKFMPNVESVKVVERSADGSRVVADWVGVAPEFKLKIRWTEEDVWDDASHTCRFRMLKGDYNAYAGEWTFTALPDGGAKFTSVFDYELEIPLIGPLLKKVIAKLMHGNTQEILDAIKGQAEKSG